MARGRRARPLVPIYRRLMNDKRIWFLAGVLMLVAAAVNAATGNWVPAALLALAGVLFLITPSWQAGRSKRGR